MIRVSPGSPEFLVPLDRLVYSRWAISHGMKSENTLPTRSVNERRSGTRVPARVSTRVRTEQGSEQTAETRDVSANGVYLYTNSRMEKGAEVELVLILPPELTSGEKCWVCCQATVVRVEEGPQFGVAAQIRRMDILPEVSV